MTEKAGSGNGTGAETHEGRPSVRKEELAGGRGCGENEEQEESGGDRNPGETKSSKSITWRTSET